MDLFFLNKNRELVGIIDTAKSIQWLERYYEVGTFEVYIEVSDDVMQIVNQSYFISRNDSKFVGVIEVIRNEDSEDEGNYLIIQGRFASVLLSRRIIRNITYLNTTISNMCKKLIEDNLTNPPIQYGESVSPRKMTCIKPIIRFDLQVDETIETQATFENILLTFLQEKLKAYKSAIMLELKDDNLFEVVIYQGKDRSYAQEENSFVVFSKTFDNLISSQYEFNTLNEANALYVGGENNELAPEGRYVDKYELPVGSGVVSDMDRIETFINASDLKQKWEDEEGQSHELTSEQYRELLRKRGQENVTEPTESLTAEIDISMYVYGVDFFLGDIVRVENEQFGMYENKRIIGMDVLDDENGHTLNPIFDE